MDERPACLSVELPAGEQMGDVAGLFRLKIHPKRARHNPIRDRPNLNAFFGCIQGIPLLRRNPVGEHEMVHTGKCRAIQFKSAIRASGHPTF
jgi:hypothetical protein